MAAVHVGDPLARIFSVIQIQHRRHRVHPDPVGMIFFRPKQGVGNQEVGNLGPSVIIDQGSPVRVAPLSRIQMLIQAGSVESRQAMGVPREMGRNPIQDHADPLLMHMVHKRLKIIGRSIPAGGRVISRHLIAPGFIQRMLHNRQKLHMGIAHPLHIFRQLRRDLPVIIELASIDRLPFLIESNRLLDPGAQMDLVDIHRDTVLLFRLPLVHPFLIVPFIFRKIPYDRRRVGAKLRIAGVRVRL